jgi:aspartate-semialdehyde dehydrogenase
VTARIPVSVLGATGTVGQKLIRLLEGHPWFEVAALAASERSAGRPYGEVVRWREPTHLSERIAAMTVAACAPPLPGVIAFSAVEAELAPEIEESFARAGVMVVTNTKSHRMEPDVPLLIPEINPDHLALLERQRAGRGWTGGIVANPNCSTAGLVLALAPLHAAFGVEKVFVSTMQAISGAGYPGVASLDILGNVIPYIGGEEEKIEVETRKILGAPARDAEVVVSAHTSRVPAVDGHLEVVSIGLSRRVSPEEVMAVLDTFRPSPAVAALPSTPPRTIEVDRRADRPQTRLDLDRGGGMTVTVGRVRHCPLLDIRLALLSHNTVRGAAGAAIQNAELVVASGLVPGVSR